VIVADTSECGSPSSVKGTNAASHICRFEAGFGPLNHSSPPELAKGDALFGSS
jgi:hypothetical protein